MPRVMADDDPFEAVVGAHHAEIRRYLLRITARVSDADDLSQETFLRAFRAHRSLPPGANVRAWLFAIATNLCRNHFRAQTRRRRAYAAAALDRPEADPGWPEGEAVAGETRARIEGVVAGLPVKQRLAFIMRKLHDLDYPTIGGSLDCSEESARAHVFQALRKIRRSLDGRILAKTESQP
jgi:RNA polymerase sigma-70 factor (ECF subfamily)